ncbi:MAG TPA: SMC-Scp complex subunit ScpB [Candidatus Eisenbacteria bacterium]|nr:SMC-Scp complex subunit ScpB [Candidatus Eisenbacteria bacterium]
MTPTPKQILEALLFASDAPVPLSALVEVLDGLGPSEVSAILTELGREYEESERGVALAEIAGGYQILSRRECAPWIEEMLRSRRKARLSRAGLETLAIVAYKQPITKVEIDGIRGVDSGGSLHTLLERNLVLIRGRSKGVGRPLLYGTTPDFLSYMGVNELSDLPELKELGSVLEERERVHGELEDVSPATTVEGPDLFHPEAVAESAGDAEPSSDAEAKVEEAMSPEGAA